VIRPSVEASVLKECKVVCKSHHPAEEKPEKALPLSIKDMAKRKCFCIYTISINKSGFL
jgi:hypothetical protein